MNLMIAKRPATLLSCIFIFTFLTSAMGVAQPVDSVRVNLFDLIRPSYEVMEFVSESKFVADYKTLTPRLADALKRFDIVSDARGTNEEVWFRSNDGTITFTIYQRDDGDYLYEKWRNTIRTMGVKSDIRNDEGGSVFFKVKTTPDNGSIGALFYTGRNLFEIFISLPFPVETFEKLDAAGVSVVRKKYETLFSIMEVIARTYVMPDEFILYPSQQLTREQRLYGLVQFWTEVKYNFAFFDHVPDLNWDHVLAKYLAIVEKEQTNETYYNNLSEMCALLKDGHTNIYKPASIEATITTPPIQLMNIQNNAIVVNTDVSLAEKIPVGSEIISVDGMQVSEYLAKKIFPFISSSTEHILVDNGIRWMLQGRTGTSVNIGYRTAAGKELKHVLYRSGNREITWVRPLQKTAIFEFKRLPGNVAYVAINTFGNQKVVGDFENHIDSINSCSGLIIDLRSNGGGNSSNAYRIIEHLTDKAFLTSKWRTREHRAAFKAWGSFRVDNFRNAARSGKDEPGDFDKLALEYYKGDHWHSDAAQTIDPPKNKKVKLPLVVLIGHKTASAAEDFLIAIENTKRATTVGSKTFGSTGQPLPMKLPGGGSARICTKRDEYPDGRQFVGFGVKPDIEFESSVEDLISGKDVVLGKALEVVTKIKR